MLSDEFNILCWLITVRRHSGARIPSWKLSVCLQTRLLLSGHQVNREVLQWDRDWGGVREADAGESPPRSWIYMSLTLGNFPRWFSILEWFREWRKLTIGKYSPTPSEKGGSVGNKKWRCIRNYEIWWKANYTSSKVNSSIRERPSSSTMAGGPLLIVAAVNSVSSRFTEFRILLDALTFAHE